MGKAGEEWFALKLTCGDGRPRVFGLTLKEAYRRARHE